MKSKKPLTVVIAKRKKRKTKIPTVIPTSKVIKLRYTEGWVSNGSTIDYVFRLNSLFDPNYTGAGHQPLGFDQWATFYGKYRVTSVKWKLTTSTLYGYSYKVAVVATPKETALADTVRASELPGGQFSYSTVNQRAIIKGNAINSRILGLTSTEYGDVSIYGATISANPSVSPYLHVVYTTQGDTVVASGDMYHTLELIMTAEMLEPIQLAQS